MRAKRWIGRTAGIVSVTKRFVRSLEQGQHAQRNGRPGQGGRFSNGRRALAALSLIPALFAALPLPAQEAPAPAPTASELPAFQFSTLDRVRQRGYVICGSTQQMAGFAQRTSDGLWSGFDVDICRAVAAAVFGDPSRVEFRPLSGTSRFAHLQQGDVDLLSRNAAWTMQRDTRYGATYVATSFYDGQAFMAREDVQAVSAYELSDVTVCVAAGSEEARVVEDFFTQNGSAYEPLLYEDRDDLAVAYRSGRCEVISGPASWLQAIRRTVPEPARHIILPERLSKNPFGPVVLSANEQWLTIVRWTIFAMINAEELGVTSQNIDSLTSARTPAIRLLLGLDGDLGTPLGLSPTWMRDVIRGVGNYGEVYDRHFGSGTNAPLLRGQNGLWTTGGLMFAPPFQ